jgi:protein SCO1/2
MTGRTYAIVVTLMALASLGIGIAANHIAKTATTASSEDVKVDSTFTSEFSLVDQDGRPVTAGDLRGRFQLVFFGYTSCPDICPTAMVKIGQVMDELGPDAARIVPIMISVDPERDTPAVLRQFQAQFDPRIVALTGTARQVANALRNFRAFAAKQEGVGGEYTMDHTSFYYLMAPDGVFQGILAARGEVDEIVDGIRVAMPDPARVNG